MARRECTSLVESEASGRVSLPGGGGGECGGEGRKWGAVRVTSGSARVVCSGCGWGEPGSADAGRLMDARISLTRRCTPNCHQPCVLTATLS